MGTLFRLPMVVRGVIYAAVGFAVAYLACLAWDFDRLHNDYNASRMGGRARSGSTYRRAGDRLFARSR
jgi:hypothetical protein